LHWQLTSQKQLNKRDIAQALGRRATKKQRRFSHTRYTMLWTGKRLWSLEKDLANDDDTRIV
jgi:hypothetical protein